MNVEKIDATLNLLNNLRSNLEKIEEKEITLRFLQNFELNIILLSIYSEKTLKKTKTFINKSIRGQTANLVKNFELSYQKIFNLYFNLIFNIESVLLSIFYNISKEIPEYGHFYDILNYIANNFKIDDQIKVDSIKSRLSDEYNIEIDSILFLLKFFGVFSLNYFNNDYLYKLKKKIVFSHEIDVFKEFLFKEQFNPHKILVYVDRKFTNIAILFELLQKEKEKKLKKKDNLSILKNIEMNEEIKKIQEKIKFFNEKEEILIVREKRDTVIATKLKNIYNYNCQMCKLLKLRAPRFQTKSGNYYCETHHIIFLSQTDGPDNWVDFMEESLLKPMKKKGLDIIENMIVLCPHHHTFLHHYYKNLIFSKDKTGKYFFISRDKKEQYPFYVIDGHYN